MFKNAKVGDRVWDFLFGWGTIHGIVLDNRYPIEVKFENEILRTYTFNGFLDDNHKNPTLFFGKIKFEIPEKPFNLEDELKKLEIQEFCCGEENFHLYWDNEEQEISIRIAEIFEEPLCVYFNEESIINFQESIKGKEIKKEQFFRAYKNIFGGK